MPRQRRTTCRRRPRCTPAFVLPLLLGDCRGFLWTFHRQGVARRATAARNRPTPFSHRRFVPTSLRLHARNSGQSYGRFEDAGWVEDDVSRRRNWQEIGNADVLVPEEVEFPLGVVHFTGGAGVGIFPRSAYGTLLEALVDEGFLVVATRTRLNEFNHQELACDSARDFRVAFREVEALYGRAAVGRMPVFGVGHSLGAKVHMLMNCYPEVTDVARRRKANVFISFNNFPAGESVPFLNQLRSLGASMGSLGPLGDNLSGLVRAVADVPVMGGIATQGLSLAEEWAPRAVAAVGSALTDVPEEFTPTPEDTWYLLEDEYSVQNNFVLQFKRDTIDQSPRLAETLFNRFGRDGELKYSRLDGSHLTPNTPDLRDTRRTREWVDKLGLGEEGDGLAEEGAELAASAASRELEGLVASLTSYLRSQSLWVRLEGRWDSDDM